MEAVWEKREAFLFLLFDILFIVFLKVAFINLINVLQEFIKINRECIFNNVLYYAFILLELEAATNNQDFFKLQVGSCIYTTSMAEICFITLTNEYIWN